MTVLGQEIENFTSPVCSSFKPTILAGQRCYQLNLDDFDNSVRPGPLGGVSFVMDYNEERNVEIHEPEESTPLTYDNLVGEEKKSKKKEKS